VWQATADFPSIVEDLLGVMGRGGYEGMQADADGNVWVVEDIGGAIVAGARLPNSFVYRLVPKNRFDLRQGGKFQALQVMSKANPGEPIAFQTASALTRDIEDLHTFGLVFDTQWVTIHDTDVDGFAPFNANALAKTKRATPFKRPENAQFRPGSGFREFFFDETGDTSATSTANANHGGFGSLMKLTQKSPSADTGKLALFFKGDLEHAAFDNVAFFDEHRLIAVEDRGDGLHSQGNALDSAWLFDTRFDYADPANKPVRILAQGRDASAVIDSALGAVGNGFQNDGDNEITGIHVSDGDPTARGLLGAKIPRPFHDGWRVFYTGQHGDNDTYEIVPNLQKRLEFDY
jgi:secreted PhoX family phosphatase